MVVWGKGAWYHVGMTAWCHGGKPVHRLNLKTYANDPLETFVNHFVS